MDAIVKRILPNSPADEAGMLDGDRIIAVNGQSDLEDLFDFQMAQAMGDELTLDIERDGTALTLTIDLSDEDEVGLEFQSPIFTPIKTCNNDCPFCFIDQQPEGLRPSLYVKDDDYRLSYFCNTYVTLTNLTRHDRARIERFRPGPLYVSVHSTVPEVRAELLKNSKAGEIMTELGWLASLEVPFHAQIVVCPGINDTDSLSQTLKDLASLQPHCLSVAVVPVGLTDHRNLLPGLVPVSKDCANQVIDRVNAFLESHSDPQFAFLSDEFYVYADRTFPSYEQYGEFPQLDDGVGTGRHLLKTFFDLEHTFPKQLDSAKNHLIVTGKLASMMLQPMVKRLNQIDGLYVDMVAVENRFWGEAITVAGLVTGQDIVYTLKDMDLSGYASVLIPDTMLRNGEDVFLDNMSVREVEAAIGCPIEVVHDPNEADSLLKVLW